MAWVYLLKSGIRSFSLFLQQNPLAREPDLGLSLSYDIVKAHGGEIRIDSMANEYTIFHVDLPV